MTLSLVLQRMYWKREVRRGASTYKIHCVNWGFYLIFFLSFNVIICLKIWFFTSCCIAVGRERHPDTFPFMISSWLYPDLLLWSGSWGAELPSFSGCFSMPQWKRRNASHRPDVSLQFRYEELRVRILTVVKSKLSLCCWTWF